MFNENISWNRVGLLLKRELVVNGQMHLWILLGLLLLFGINLNNGLSIKDVWALEDGFGRRLKLHYELFLVLNQLAILAVFFAISVMTSIAFGEFRQRNQTQFYLGLPAHPMEKWLSKLLICLFIIPIACVLTYVLLANGLLLATRVEGEPIRWFTFADIVINRTVNLQLILLFSVLPAFSLLVAVLQPKYAFIKGISILVVGFFVFRIFRRMILTSLTGTSMKDLEEINAVSSLYPFFGNIGVIGLILLGVGLMYLVAYFYFKEKEA